MSTYGKRDHMYLSRIVLTPKRVSAASPEFEREVVDGWGHNTLSAYGVARYESRITGITDDWTVTFETDYTDRYKKLNAMLGHNLAMSALEALDGPVPDEDDLEHFYDTGYVCCSDCG